MKKRLTQHEEFEIMKLVLDKFLWLGFGIMAYGFYVLISAEGSDAFLKGLPFLIGGSVILMIFMLLIIKEYEIVK